MDTISQSILLSHGNRSGPYPGKNRGLERGVSCVVVVPRRRYSAIELVLATEKEKSMTTPTGGVPDLAQMLTGDNTVTHAKELLPP